MKWPVFILVISLIVAGCNNQPSGNETSKDNYKNETAMNDTTPKVTGIVGILKPLTIKS